MTSTGEAPERTPLSRTRIGSGVSPRLYQRAFAILRGQILRGELAPASRLIETGVAERFGISRAPARRALAELARAGLIEKAAGRGYLVQAGVAARTPANAAAGERAAAVLTALPTWQRIYGEVEREITARTSFASWRVVEAELARQFGVSRTVARDVLGRLQQRGVIEKDERGRWRARALSPERIGELYELRWTLEPLALAKAARHVPPRELAAMRRDLHRLLESPDLISGPALDQLEEDMHVDLLSHCRNPTLMQAITLPQALLIVHRFLYAWAPRLYATEPFLCEHVEVVERLQAGRVDEAAAALRRHLQVSRERAIGRVSLVAGEFEPQELAYLERIADP